MTFNELLNDLGERLGGQIDLTPDESNTVNLNIDAMSVAILGLEEIDGVVLTGVVGEPPPADKMENLYRAILMANHNFAGTNGATFSINPETKEVSICRMLPLSMTDGEKFFAEMEKFINTMELWKKIISDFRGAEINAQGEEVAEANEPTAGYSNFMQV